MSKQKKTDASVKTGLKISSGAKPDKLKKPGATTAIPEETDSDDLVHRSGVKKPTKAGQSEDMDDLVHQKRATVKVNAAEEQDIDDIQHTKNEYRPDH